MSNQKNTYDVTRDRVLGPVLVIHLDNATGSRVGTFGEGVGSYGIALRSMMNEEGVAGPARVSIHGAFVAKKAGTEKFQRWQVDAKGRASLGITAEGSVCLGAGIGRLDAHIAAALYPIVASFATKALAALSAKKAA